jgi:hypothetical protein
MRVSRLWSELFPWPFIGAVVLLVILIFLTPNLLLNGTPAAGTLATQAELIVDRVAGNNTTHFYVNGLGTLRYAEMRALVATNLSWPVATPANLSWHAVTAVNNTLSLLFVSTANPVAVNVTALYVDAAGTAIEYYGAFAFDVAGLTISILPLAPGLGTVPPTPVGALPLSLLLATTTPGTMP